MTFEQMQAIVEGMLQSQQLLIVQQEQLTRQQEQLGERQQQFQEKIEQEMNLFLARQRELQESDLRRQSELDQVSQRLDEVSQRLDEVSQRLDRVSEQIEGLTLIAERLVTNAEINNRITDDHEERIRRLEQE